MKLETKEASQYRPIQVSEVPTLLQIVREQTKDFKQSLDDSSLVNTKDILQALKLRFMQAPSFRTPTVY